VRVQAMPVALSHRLSTASVALKKWPSFYVSDIGEFFLSFADD